MFSKFKDAVGEGAIRSAIATYGPKINQKLGEMTMLQPADVKDDARYRSRVVMPALTAVMASSNGATRLIPNFEQRFTRALLHVRDRLVIIDEASNTVSLVPDYQSRVGEVLLEGFRQPA